MFIASHAHYVSDKPMEDLDLPYQTSAVQRFSGTVRLSSWHQRGVVANGLKSQKANSKEIQPCLGVILGCGQWFATRSIAPYHLLTFL